MIHEETTTEIEIPGYKKTSNVVSFPSTPAHPMAPKAKAIAVADGWEFEPRWAIRLLAVLTVLLLSLLML